MTLTGTKRTLDGKRVAITSRLASMSRDEARERIAASGGIYASTTREDTNLLIVGQGGPPLGDDGKLTRSLQRARELQSAGFPIRILAEKEFLERIGLEERHEDFHRLYTTEQLRRIVGISAHDIRQWVRHELIRPVQVVNRLCFFDFQQVTTARTLCRLTRDGVGAQSIRRSLESLQRWLPGSEAALSQLESLEGGGPLLVRTDEGRLAEANGQLRIEFDVEDEGESPVTRGAHMSLCAIADAETHFDIGVQAEADGDLQRAMHAYQRALELNGPVAELAFNLGNTLHALERPEESVQRFEQATNADPSYVEAWNNMANVLAEIGRVEEAVSAYRRALCLAPEYADAHYNLADTLAAMGAMQEARRHWRAYLLQDPHSSTAQQVRDRLALPW